MHANSFVMTQILFIIQDVLPNLTIIRLNNSNNAKTTITTPEVQNYHFAPRGNMLGLFFLNYYRVLFT